jgi:hypothetical protein
MLKNCTVDVVIDAVIIKCVTQRSCVRDAD